MKISPFFTNIIDTKNKKINNTIRIENTATPLKSESNIMPTAQMVLAFCGGKSMDLAQTIVQLDKFATYPPDIREIAVEELRTGNKNNKTLIDIHKEKYLPLYECDTMEEVREKFPEFQDVLSDKEVLYREDSFLAKAKRGEIKHFDKDKDIAVQLLQMYWASGISLTDFKTELAGQSVVRTFNKLNIPRLNNQYAHYLGFSDPVKNEHFAEHNAQITIQRNKIKRENGIPIKATPQGEVERGPLSAEHKTKISQGLKEYYKQHPEMAFQIGEAHKKYFEEHPKEKDVFSQVLYRAWDYPETKPIRKALAKHMKMQNLTKEEIIKLSSNTFNQDMQAFWDKNAWARNKWSQAMTKSWARQKFLQERGMTYEPTFEVRLLPQAEIRRIQKETGKSFEEIQDEYTVYLRDDRDGEGIDPSEFHKTEIENSEYIKRLRYLAILYSLTQIYSNEKIRNLQVDNRFNVIMSEAKHIQSHPQMYSSSDLSLLYTMIIYSLSEGNKDWAQTFIDSTEKIDTILRTRKNDIQKISTEFFKIAQQF